MKLIDYIAQKTGRTKEEIYFVSCPSTYGEEFKKYNRNCVGDCWECWEQEMEE